MHVTYMSIRKIVVRHVRCYDPNMETLYYSLGKELLILVIDVLQGTPFKTLNGCYHMLGQT